MHKVMRVVGMSLTTAFAVVGNAQQHINATATNSNGSGGGVTPVFSIASVSTGAAGSQASVTIDNSDIAHPKLSLTLPQGLPGTTGSPGTPGTNGTNGVNGTTPTFAIGTITTLAAGAQATVTVSGTAPNYVLNFGIPQGAAGSGSGSVTLPANASAIGTDSSGNPVKVNLAPVALSGSAADITTGVLAPARVPVATQSSYGATKLNYYPQSLWGYGDSYVRDIGVNDTSLAGPGVFGLLARSTSALTFDNGIAGSMVNNAAASLFSSYAPDPQRSNAVILMSGANDGNNDSCGGTATSACANNYVLGMTAAARYASLPWTGYRQYASTAVLSGAWNAGSVINPYVNPNVASSGTPMYTNVANATAGFTVPASSTASAIGVTWGVYNGFAGTFTISIDGVLQTAKCSGTTTFATAPCTAFVNGTAGVFTQDFPVTPNTQHNVTINNLSANYIYIHSVDWAPPAGNSTTNVVFVGGPNPYFPYATVYDNLAKQVVSTLSAEGLPVFSFSQITGTPAVNGTTDVSTTATALCSGSTFAGHLNTCGQYHLFQNIYTAEVAANYVFNGTPNSGSAYTANNTPFAPSATTDTTNASNITSGTLPAAQTAALTGDVTKAAGSAATTVTKTNGVAFAPSATTDTTNAANITSGTLPVGRIPAFTGDCSVTSGTSNIICSNFTGNPAYNGGWTLAQATGGDAFKYTCAQAPAQIVGATLNGKYVASGCDVAGNRAKIMFLSGAPGAQGTSPVRQADGTYADQAISSSGGGSQHSYLVFNSGSMSGSDNASYLLDGWFGPTYYISDRYKKGDEVMTIPRAITITGVRYKVYSNGCTATGTTAGATVRLSDMNGGSETVVSGTTMTSPSGVYASGSYGFDSYFTNNGITGLSVVFTAGHPLIVHITVPKGTGGSDSCNLNATAEIEYIGG